MKTNFDINLPSIPGKYIKFKIQDIKSKAFGTQGARFKDNKGALTKKFIQSFSNFHEPVQVKYEQERQTEAQSELSQSNFRQKSVDFRVMIPDQKKHLILLQQEIQEKKHKDQEQQKKKINGYTFNKALSYKSVNNSEENNITAYQLTDNYYFTKADGHLFQQNTSQQKKQKISAVFRNQTRKRVFDRVDKVQEQLPGPGAYFTDQTSKQIAKIKNKRHLSEQKTQKMKKGLENSQGDSVNYKRFKNIIKNIMIKEQPKIEEEEQENQQQKPVRNDHMFVLDDRDRFGDQIYPIAPKLKVPGPGTYQIKDNMETKAKKILILQQQRKLLKQWFNN